MQTKRSRKPRLLDSSKRGGLAQGFLEFSESRIIGQPRIRYAFADALERAEAGFRDKERPMEVILIDGPSGSGKTESVKVLAEYLFKRRRALVRIEGPDYSERHAVSKLKGPPPGYIGYDEEPAVTQQKLDEPDYDRVVQEFRDGLDEETLEKLDDLEYIYISLRYELSHLISSGCKPTDKKVQDVEERMHQVGARIQQMGFPVYDPREGNYLSLFHIDEIHRAHRTLYNLLYRVFDEGILELSVKQSSEKPDVVRFTNTIIVMTSNCGEEEIARELRILGSREVRTGFAPDKVLSADELDTRVYKIGRDAVAKHFEAPFLGRVDHIVIARPLMRDSVERIVDLQIGNIQRKLVYEWDFPLAIRLGPRAKQFIVDEATDKPELGARLLRNKLEHFIVTPIARLRNTKQISVGDVLNFRLSRHGKEKTIDVYKGRKRKFKVTPIQISSDKQ